MRYISDMGIKKIICILIAVCMLAILPGCGDASDDVKSTHTAVKSGEVSSPDDLTQIGVYLDVDHSCKGITDVKYTISGDIGIVSFRYNGVKTELRGSYKYESYTLAGVNNTSNGDMIYTDVQGCHATFYTLNPGRIAFWSDGTINYSLYVYVTATDEVLRDILTHITFENRYMERLDVKDQIDTGSQEFADRIRTVFNDKDLKTLKDMIYYPQELGEGQSVANENELMALDPDHIFTDILLKALNSDKDKDQLRLSEDGSEYIIGTNYKNVHFKWMDDGYFLITKINN